MYGKEIEKVLITNEDVRNRLKEVAKKSATTIRAKTFCSFAFYAGRLCFSPTLSGKSANTTSNAQVDFIAVSSYGEGTVSTGEVKFIKDCSTPISGKNVIIVEDIVDTGITLNYLKRCF